MGAGAVCEIDLSFAAPDHIERNQKLILEFVKTTEEKSFEHAIRVIQAIETNPSRSSPSFNGTHLKIISQRALQTLWIPLNSHQGGELKKPGYRHSQASSAKPRT